MKSLTLLLLLTFSSLITFAQLKPDSKVFMTFEQTQNEVNVDGDNAIAMLKEYIIGKTSLVISESKESADFTFKLRIIEKKIGNRRGKLDMIDNQTSATLFESKWVTGTSNAFYGYSGSRHAIGLLVKDQLIKAFPNISK
jgi:hypothetical protein